MLGFPTGVPLEERRCANVTGVRRRHHDVTYPLPSAATTGLRPSYPMAGSTTLSLPTNSGTAPRRSHFDRPDAWIAVVPVVRRAEDDQARCSIRRDDRPIQIGSG